MHARATTVEAFPTKLDEATHLSVSPTQAVGLLARKPRCVGDKQRCLAGARTNSKRTSCRRC
jgi:hypothetical protein